MSSHSSNFTKRTKPDIQKDLTYTAPEADNKTTYTITKDQRYKNKIPDLIPAIVLFSHHA